MNISILAEDAVKLVETVLPLLESSIPQVAAADAVIRLGVTGVQALAPVVGRLIDNLTAQGVITTEAQSAQLDKLQKVLDFHGIEWEPSETKPPSPPTAA